MQANVLPDAQVARRAGITKTTAGSDRDRRKDRAPELYGHISEPSAFPGIEECMRTPEIKIVAPVRLNRMAASDMVG